MNSIDWEKRIKQKIRNLRVQYISLGISLAALWISVAVFLKVIL
jgi:hypothetical protein